MRLRFLTFNKGDSAKIRGYQMGEVIGVPVDFQTLQEPCDICICVKYCHLEHIIEAQKKSEIIIYDPIDNYKFEKIHHEVSPMIDGVIAANHVHKNTLSKVFPYSKITVIQHHHCNLRQQYRDNNSSIPGYVGRPANSGIDMDTLSMAFPDFIHANSIESLSKLGIGVSYREKQEDILYKPALKLVNYWAYGIVPVISPDVSCMEICEPEKNALIAYGKNEVLAHIMRLKKDKDLRTNLSNVGLKKAVDFGIYKIAKKYMDFIHEL